MMLPLLISPTRRMRRFAGLFFSLLFLCAWTITPALAKTTSGSSIITTNHKFAPKKNKVPGTAKVSRIASIASPASPYCITRSSDMKRKPAKSRSKLISASRLRKKLSSRSAIVLDSQTGKVLYSHDPDRAAQPASTIKILTGLIAIRSLQDKEMVKASSRAAGMPRSKVYLKPGKSYKADDLINAVLLASANDASVALAEKVAGSEKSFAKLMTHKARSLGARNTVCKTASGLTAKGQKSTARDLAMVFAQAMTNKEFAKRIGKSKVRTSYGKLLRNHNKALWRVKGALGGKTGYTRAARQTYVGKFARGNTELVVAIMGSETMWDDVSRLVEYGFDKKEQLASMQKAAPVKVASVGPVSLARLSPAFNNTSLPVLSGTKKQSKL